MHHSNIPLHPAHFEIQPCRHDEYSANRINGSVTMFKRYMLLLCLCLAGAIAWDNYVPSQATEWWAMLGNAEGATMYALWFSLVIGASAVMRWVYNGREQLPAK